MSIFGSTFAAGYPDDPDSTGIVLMRDSGNHYPTAERNRIGAVDGAWIPSWIVPGHREEVGVDAPGYDEPAPWYRLGTCSWRVEAGFGRAQLWRDGEYLLDEEAARALRDDLTKWLDLPKTRPEATA